MNYGNLFKESIKRIADVFVGHFFPPMNFTWELNSLTVSNAYYALKETVLSILVQTEPLNMGFPIIDARIISSSSSMYMTQHEK